MHSYHFKIYGLFGGLKVMHTHYICVLKETPFETPISQKKNEYE